MEATKHMAQLYQLVGRSFSGYLGYPSIDQFLQKSTYFFANISRNMIYDIHMSELVSGVSRDKVWTYSDLLQGIERHWMQDPEDDNVSKTLAAETLIEKYHLGERFLHTIYTCRMQGSVRKKFVSAQLLEKDGEIYAMAMFCDVTDVKDVNIKMLHHMEFDSLTDLYNRSAGDTYIMKYFQQYAGENAAIIVLDLDHFKRFNDQYGHDVGDVILRAAARRLEQYFGRDSVIVRNGGDEFLILLRHRSAQEAEDEIQEFYKQKHSVSYQGTDYHISFSLGYAMYPEQGKEYHDLAMKADVAMYHVKMKNRSSFCKYHPDMLQQKRTQLSFNLAEVISGIPGAILVYSADEREEILFANDQLYQLFECDSMEELLAFSGDSFRNIVHPEDKERVEREIRLQLEVGASGYDYVSYRIVTKTGKIRQIDDIGHLVHSPKYGDIFYVFLYDQEQKKQIQRLAEEKQLAEG